MGRPSFKPTKPWDWLTPSGGLGGPPMASPPPYPLSGPLPPLLSLFFSRRKRRSPEGLNGPPRASVALQWPSSASLSFPFSPSSLLSFPLQFSLSPRFHFHVNSSSIQSDTKTCQPVPLANRHGMNLSQRTLFICWMSYKQPKIQEGNLLHDNNIILKQIKKDIIGNLKALAYQWKILLQFFLRSPYFRGLFCQKCNLGFLTSKQTTQFLHLSLWIKTKLMKFG